MSRILVELLGLTTALTHTAEVVAPRVELRLELTNPRSGDAIALPAGPQVSLVDGAGAVVGEAAIAAGGVVHLLGSDDATDVAIVIDFVGREWLDLEAGSYVAKGEVRDNDTRALVRLPRRWSSRDQGTYSDDRGGAFAGGSLATLDDGKLGTTAVPWVLRIDHAWRRFVLELRYANTLARELSPLPAGMRIEVSHAGAAGKPPRLAAGSTVLDARGSVALWIFDDAASLGALAIVLHSAADSYIAMDDGAITKVLAGKLRRMLPKARAKLHALPRRLGLHEQTGSQSSKRAKVSSLLPTAAHAPARIVVPIDVAIELRLTLHDPLTKTTIPLPADVDVRVIDRHDAPVASALTGEDGRTALFAPSGGDGLALELFFGDRPYLDLDTKELLAVGAGEPDTKRSLVRMPARWRSHEQASVSDDRSGAFTDGRFASVVAGELGTPDKPWELRIDHAWQRVELVFEYYDTFANAVRPVVFGPLVEAFDDRRLRERDLVGAATVLDDDGRVYLMLHRKVEPERLRVRMRSPKDSVLVMAEGDPKKRVRIVSPTELAALPVLERHQHYPLPELWLSRGQLCRRSSGTAAVQFEDAIAGALGTAPAAKRISFDLDDFVLVRPDRVPLAFARELELTIFDHDFSIRRPNIGVAHRGFFSNVAADTNHFEGRTACYTNGAGHAKTARVVRRGRKFYDLGRERTTKGRVVGVRAAIAGDHPHEGIFLKHEPGTKPNVANCDVHYFQDVAQDPASGRTLSVLMVFFSLRVHPVAPVSSTEADKLRDALVRAARRWGAGSLAEVLSGTPTTTPDIRIRTDDGKHDIKFAFHFVAFDDREGHAIVRIYPSIRAYSAAMMRIMAIEPGDLVGSATVTGVEDGATYREQTITHELGHAIGLGDEYYESLRQTSAPSLRQFPWDFLHLSFDKHSLMYGEFAPRLRHYWVFARWLERSSEIPRVREQGYAIECDTSTVPGASAGRAHRFRLPPAHDWPYAEARREPRFRRGPHGRGNLGLFLLGDDLDVVRCRSSGVVTGIDAVLHWDLTIYFDIDKNVDGAKPASGKRGSLERLCNEMLAAVGDFRILPPNTIVEHCFVADLDTGQPASSLAATHAKRVLVYVLPRFTLNNPAAADFRVHLRAMALTDHAANLGDLHDPSHDRAKVAISELTPGAALMRYMLGATPSQARPGAQATIGATSLASGFGVSTTNGLSKVLTAAPGTRTSGLNDFRASGTTTAIAVELSAAINDPANAFAAHVRASTSGATVKLSAVTPGVDISLNSAAPGITVQSDWRDRFEPSELGFLATWIGGQLGATYRIKHFV